MSTIVSLRERILNVAQNLFYQKGFFATNTRGIAKEAGTSESGIFRLFHNKYDLLMAVYNDCWGKVNGEIEFGLANKYYDDPRLQLINIFKILFELYEIKPLVISFIIMNTGNTDTLIIANKDHAIISDENLKYINRIEGFCRECINKRLVPESLTARSLCEGLLGISEGILLGWYLYDKTNDAYPEKITLREALNLVSTLLYGGAYNEPVSTCAGSFSTSGTFRSSGQASTNKDGRSSRNSDR